MLAIGLQEGRVEVSRAFVLPRIFLQLSRQFYLPRLLQVLHLKLEYRTEDDETCERELERFLHYVSII